MASIVIISITTVIFGIIALVISSRARKRLTPGSLRSYIDNFNVCLSFIVLFTIWQTIRSFQGVDIQIKGLGDYPEYIFIFFAYISFIITSYRLVKISKEFGFKEEGKIITEIVQSKKK
ncbi:MAG: hypothetical protein AABY14_00895 [Nanoarchaeota archaeon]